MSIDKETLAQMYFSNDVPCPLKLKCGYTLHITPVKVKDWAIFSNSLSIITINKNRIDNVEILSKSYLDFLFGIINGIYDIGLNSDCSYLLAYVLFYSLGVDYHKIVKDENGRSVLCLCKEDGTIYATITSKEFDDLKEIILFQNLIDYDDRYIDPDVEQLRNDYYRIKYRDRKTPTFEEKRTYVMAKCGFTAEQINDMTYRAFSQIYQHAIDDVLFIGEKIIQGSYKYKVDKDVTHPLYTKKKDEYEELFTNAETLASKGISGTEQLTAMGM